MNVLVVGLGSIAKKHIGILRTLRPDVQITALRSGASDASVEGVIDIASLDLLPWKPDMVLVSNPTFLHLETMRQVVPLGSPIFLEKPLALTVPDGDAIVQLVEAAKVPTYIGCYLRFHACIQYLKEHLPADPINEVNVYCGSYAPEWQPGTDMAASFRSKSTESGGVHLELIHELDYLTWFFGMPRETRRTTRHVSTLGFDADDYANYVLCYDRFAANVVLNYYRRDPKRQLEIVFRHRTWVADLLACTIREGETLIFETEKTMLDAYIDQMRYVLDCVDNATPFMNNAREAAGVLRLALS